MRSSNLDTARAIKLVQELNALSAKNKWPLVVLGFAQRSTDVDPVGFGVLRVNPNDAEHQRLIVTHKKIGQPLLAASVMYGTSTDPV